MRSTNVRMVTLGVAALAVGCAGPMEETRGWSPPAAARGHQAPLVFLNDVAGFPSPAALDAMPPLTVVGTVVAEGPDTLPASDFLAQARQKGIELGCDALIDNDVYLAHLAALPLGHSEGQRAVGHAAWEFLCARGDAPGAAGAPSLSRARAPSLPVTAFVTIRCQLTYPTGSHIARTACFSERNGRLIAAASPDYLQAFGQTPSYVIDVWWSGVEN